MSTDRKSTHHESPSKFDEEETRGRELRKYRVRYDTPPPRSRSLSPDRKDRPERVPSPQVLRELEKLREDMNIDLEPALWSTDVEMSDSDVARQTAVFVCPNRVEALDLQSSVYSMNNAEFFVDKGLGEMEDFEMSDVAAHDGFDSSDWTGLFNKATIAPSYATEMDIDMQPDMLPGWMMTPPSSTCTSETVLGASLGSAFGFGSTTNQTCVLNPTMDIDMRPDMAPRWIQLPSPPSTPSPSKSSERSSQSIFRTRSNVSTTQTDISTNETELGLILTPPRRDPKGIKRERRMADDGDEEYEQRQVDGQAGGNFKLSFQHHPETARVTHTAVGTDLVASKRLITIGAGPLDVTRGVKRGRDIGDDGYMEYRRYQMSFRESTAKRRKNRKDVEKSPSAIPLLATLQAKPPPISPLAPFIPLATDAFVSASSSGPSRPLSDAPSPQRGQVAKPSRMPITTVAASASPMGEERRFTREEKGKGKAPTLWDLAAEKTATEQSLLEKPPVPTATPPLSSNEGAIIPVQIASSPSVETAPTVLKSRARSHAFSMAREDEDAPRGQKRASLTTALSNIASGRRHSEPGIRRT